MGNRCLVLAALLAPVISGAAAQPQLAPAHAPAPTRRALLIGIQSYSLVESGWRNLEGPLNDVDLARLVLTERFGFPETNITILRDRDATRAAIAQAFAALIAATGPGDLVYIHYSGHGSLVADANGDEGVNGKDATLVPIDARKGGAYEILDDEIALWMAQLRQRTKDVILVVDACHSGTVTRGEESLQSRGAPLVDERDYGWSKALRAPLDVARAADPSPFLVRVSASQERQLAWEYAAPDGKRYGLLAWCWYRALSDTRPGQTWGDTFRGAAARIAAVRRDQRPVLDGVDDTLVFAGAFEARPAALAVVSVREDQVVLLGGALDGVVEGSEYESTAPKPVGDPSPRGRVEITRVEAARAYGTLRGGSVAPGELLAETRHSSALPDYRIRIMRSDERWQELALALEQRLRGIPCARLARAGESADLILDLETQNKRNLALLRFLDGAEQPYESDRLARLDMELDRSSKRMAECFRRVGRLARLWQLEGVATDRDGIKPEVAVELIRARCKDKDEEPRDAKPLGPSSTLPAGTCISFRIRNGSPLPVYAHILNLKPSGGILPVFPSEPGDDRATRCEAGEEFQLDRRVMLETLDVGLIDRYLVFIADEPLPTHLLGESDLVQRSATRGGAQDPCAAPDRLRRIICEIAGRTRGVSRGATSQGADLAAYTFDVRVAPSK